MILYLSNALTLTKSVVQFYKIQNGLFTYGHFTNKEQFAEIYHIFGESPEFCIDSGAFTFMTDYYKHRKITPIAKVEQYIDNYLRTLISLDVSPRFVVELDLQEFYGDDAVRAWRRDIFAPFERHTGIRVCYVWHVTDGQEGWRALLDDPNVTVLGVPSRQSVITAQNVIDAYNASKLVHGFACTKNKVLKDIPFFSADSTSWCSYNRFGDLRIFDPIDGQLHSISLRRRHMRSNLDKLWALNIDLSEHDFEQLNYQKINNVMVEQWNKYGEWITAYWRHRGIDWSSRAG